MPNVTNDQLFHAAKAGDLSVLKEWKKQNNTQNEGDGVNFKIYDLWTPLHLACSNGHLECVKYLIESCGANVNCKDNHGYTPLHLACSNGHLECVKYLIESCEADINCKSNRDNTPLHLACSNGHLECVKYLIESCEANINCRDNNGNAPLHDACSNDHLECVKYLVESCEADISCKDRNGRTPLHWACRYGHLECVKYLIESCEADINCNNHNHGWTSLHEACCSGQLECVKYLIESCEADINCKNSDGWTPLHWACYNGHLECVAYLVASANANTDITNKDNKTPLDMIDATIQIKMIKRLDHLSHRNSQLQEKNEQLKQQLERKEEEKTQKEQENEQLKQQLEQEKEEKTQKEEENEQLKQQLEREEEEKKQKEEENEQLKQQKEEMQHMLSKSQQENEQLKRQLKQHLKISIDQDRHAAFRTEAIADVTFLCGQGDEQQPIKANSGVLRVTVPSIQTLINSGIQHQHANDGTEDGAVPIETTIPLPNLQPKHVRYVLQCIYTGEISFDDNTPIDTDDDASHQPTPTLNGQDDLQQLVFVANEFGFWRLKLALEAELTHKHLTEDTMIDVLIFADQHNCLVLKDAAMRMAGEHENTLFTHPDFKKLFPHQQLMGDIHFLCSGGAESDGIDDEYSRMSMMELYKVVNEDEGTAQVDSYMDQVTLVDFVRSLNIKSSKVIEMDDAATEDLNPDRATAMTFLPWLLVLLLALRLPMPQDLLYSGAVGLISSFLMSLSDAPHLRSLFVTARHPSLASSLASSASSSSLAMVAFIDAGWRAILCAAATCLITSLLRFFVA